eukprot:5894480-Prymnesium_polylepis.1
MPPHRSARVGRTAPPPKSTAARVWAAAATAAAAQVPAVQASGYQMRSYRSCRDSRTPGSRSILGATPCAASQRPASAGSSSCWPSGCATCSC